MHTIYCTQRFRQFIEMRGQYGLHMFDAQHAEQDDGVLECNRSARRVWEMFSTLKFTRFTQMQCRKCCFDVCKLLMSNDNECLPHPGASTVVMRNNELYGSGLIATTM